ncbi:MarR family winged helix-turn-helix transcriptional regulator [Porcipelethomonas sp.]|uniref:MarR family winged helix-turn-helix transcriptional regulator n=1 Tax=Porcipelethomonas sp. TaxID=2981675 RepID=UPI003EF1DBCD
MDYDLMAEELVNMRSSQPQIRFERKLSKVMKGEGFVLNYLKNHNNQAHPKDLSDEMVVSTARIAVLLNHLEHDQLIMRFPDSRDNRQIIVKLSEKGVSLLEEYHQETVKYMVKILEKLGKDDAAEYVRIQKKLMGILSEG